MRLDSARNLKYELLKLFVVPYVNRATVTAARAAVRSLAVSAQPVENVHGIHRAVALGVAQSGREYKLAVRLQRQQFWDSELLEAIRKIARNEVDVRMIGKVVKRAPRTAIMTARKSLKALAAATGRPWYQANARPLLIGVSVGHYAITAGTLGAFVRRGASTCILSNNHVLANEDRGKKGDTILQRAKYDGGSRPKDKVAKLLTWLRFSATEPNFIDAALAAVDAAVQIDPARLRGIVAGADRRLNGLASAPLDIGDRVFKVGRTTGATAGRVTAFDMDNVVVGFDEGNLRFDNQIEIEGVGNRSFSDGGDSGSLILNSKMEAMALLFAGSEQGGANGQGLTYACPIERVLRDLKATLIT
jgi:hypothetical protein